MTSPSGPNPPEEIRLALVLNGGISLAVWMAGVTYELDQCRTAATGTPSASRTAWTTLLAEANRTVKIDMIAGASAGGLNGVILGTAIARQAELTHLKKLWLDLAALDGGKLLAAKPTPRWQLLDGDFFQRRIADLLGQTTKSGAPAAEALSGAADCVLLVTATALPQAKMPEPDSRRVYRFRRRDGITPTAGPTVEATNDFELDVDDAADLALAARATASFPAAFQPVMETATLRRRRLDRHPERPSQSPTSWLMDGGILDNAPFEPMLDELIARPVSGAFKRHLVYVNPSASTPPPLVVSPAAGVGASRLVADRGPTIAATIGATLGAFRQPDRRIDGERIDEAEEAAALRSSQPDGLLEAMLLRPEAATLTRTQLGDAAAGAFDQYCASRVASYRVKYKISFAEPLPPEGTPFVPPVPPASTVDPCWDWGLSTAERVLRWWGRVMSAVAGSEQRDEAYAALYRAQLTVSDWKQQRATALSELVERDGRPSLADLLVSERGFYTDGRRREMGDVMFSAATAAAAAITADAVAAGHPGVDGADLLRLSLELDVFSSAVIRTVDRNAETPRFARWTIDPGAAAPFDFPASRDPGWPRQKLCGERWGAFGAFASEEGRKWDYLWGRLDAATRLATTLLEGVDPDVERKLLDALVTAIIAEEETTQEIIATTAAKMLELDNAGLFAIYAVGLRDKTAAKAGPSTRAAALALVRAAPGVLFRANAAEVGGLPPLPAPARFLYRCVIRFVVAPRLLRRPKRAQVSPWS